MSSNDAYDWLRYFKSAGSGLSSVSGCGSGAICGGGGGVSSDVMQHGLQQAVLGEQHVALGEQQAG